MSNKIKEKVRFLKEMMSLAKKKKDMGVYKYYKEELERLKTQGMESVVEQYEKEIDDLKNV